MFHIYTTIIGIIVAGLLLIMYSLGWVKAFLVAKVVFGIFLGLAVIGGSIYGLGLLFLGGITAFMVVIVVTYEKIKTGIIGMFRRG